MTISHIRPQTTHEEREARLRATVKSCITALAELANATPEPVPH